MWLQAITNVCPMTSVRPMASVRGIYLKVSLDWKYNSAGHHIGANCIGITLEYSRLIYWASTGHDSERERVYISLGLIRIAEPLALSLNTTHWYKPSSQVEIAMMKDSVFNITAQFSATVMKMVMSISAKGSATIEVKVLDFSRKH